MTITAIPQEGVTRWNESAQRTEIWTGSFWWFSPPRLEGVRQEHLIECPLGVVYDVSTEPWRMVR